jgi:hypothetical protein
VDISEEHDASIFRVKISQARNQRESTWQAELVNNLKEKSR